MNFSLAYVHLISLTHATLMSALFFQIMKKAVITGDFEKKRIIPAYHVTEKEKKRLRKVRDLKLFCI